MISLYDGQITDILPLNITDDPAVKAYSLALRDVMREYLDCLKLVYIYENIEELPDDILDLMAIELRTQYYSDNLDIDVKRSLVRNTLIWYMTAGTPAAVEELVAAVFGEGEVKEWFDYGGNPYYFKIVTNATLTPDMMDYFSDMIRRVKNARSHIESIEVHRDIEGNYYAGVGLNTSYKPAAIIDGYQVSRQADQRLYSGAGTNAAYKPAAIREDFKDESEIRQTIYAGIPGASQYKPAEIREALSSQATVNQAIYAGQAFISTYKNSVKEE